MSNQTKFDKYQILGVEIDALTIPQAARYITEWAAKTDSHAIYVAKPYSEFLAPAVSDPHVATILNQAELCLPDGISMLWAARWLYTGKRAWWRVVTTGASIVMWPRALQTPLPQKFGGINFTWELLAAAAKHELKLFLIGSPHGSSITQTALTIQQQLPKVKIAGTFPGELSGKMGPELRQALQQGNPEKELIERLRNTQPDLILIGMGFPLQEELMAKLVKQLDHGVLVGEGGTFDYASLGGRRPRAPQWMQSIGLEWLWRLILEPKRWRRQLAIPRFIWRVYRTGRRG